MIKEDYKYEVAIYLRGDDLEPDYVSAKLGLAPTESQRKGEKRVTSTNKEYQTKIGVWSLVAETASNELSVLIEELTSKIGSNGPILANIAGVQEAYLDIFMAVDADDEGGGTCEFQLSPAIVRALESMVVPIRFTVSIVKK